MLKRDILVITYLIGSLVNLEVEIIYGVLKRSSIICIIYAVVSFTAMRDAFAHHTRLGALRIGKDCVYNTTRLGRP